MNLILDASPDSEAFRMGYLLGTILGFAFMLGLLVFSVIAIIKALTRRTTGWIVTGSIGGAFLLLFGGVITVGVISGIMKARQSGALGTGSAQADTASGAAQTIQGRDIAYKVVLPPGWTTKRAVNDFDLIASRHTLYFAVIAEEGNLGTPETMVSFAQSKLRSASTQTEFGETSTIKIDGRDWLLFTAKCQVEKIPFAYQYAVYAGPEGSYQLVGWTLQNLFDRSAGTLRELATTFHFPAGSPPSTPAPTPAAPKVLVGESVNYKLTVPADWSVKRHAGAFDVETSYRGAYVGIVAEEGSLGTPQVALKVVQDNLRQKSTDLEISPAYAVKIDGRDWLQFTAKCRMKDFPLTYHYFVYAGSEGSFRLVGWSMQNVYDRYSDQIRDVAMTFQFPPQAASPASTASATPPETPTPAPTVAATPAKPTPRASRPKGH